MLPIVLTGLEHILQVVESGLQFLVPRFQRSSISLVIVVDGIHVRDSLAVPLQRNQICLRVLSELSFGAVSREVVVSVVGTGSRLHLGN
jgi:hypothetical protein